MTNKIVTALSLSIVILFCISPVYAFETAETQKILYTFQDGYLFNSIDTDGEYILISELKPNKNKDEPYWSGNLYLYDINEKKLIDVPGDTPSFGAAKVVNNIVYYKTADRVNPIYYSYKPEEKSAKRLDVSAKIGGENFVTDGKIFLTISGTQWPYNISLTLYNLQNSDTKNIVTLVNPDPDRIFLSDSKIIYQSLRESGNNHIYSYDIESNQTKIFFEEIFEYQMLIGTSGNNLIYLWNENAKPGDGKYQLRVLDMVTEEVKIICDEPMYIESAPERKTMNYHTAQISGPTIVWSGTTFGTDIQSSTEQLYGFSLDKNYGVQLLSDNFSGWVVKVFEDKVVWIENNSQTNQDVVYMMELRTSGEKQFEDSMLTKITESSVNMIIGFTAFLLSCYFAILWRKK